MLDAIKHGLTNLFNGQGRDARQAFWFYVLFIYIVTTAISMAVSLPLTLESVFTGIQQGIAQGQGQQDPAVAQAAVQAAMAGSMGRMIPAMMWVSLIVGVIMLVGLAASLVRRLHDSDLSGWWALLPGACQVVSMASVPTMMNSMQHQMETMDYTNPMAGFSMVSGAFGVGPLLAWVAIGLVVILGVRKSTPGPNRFGDAPFVA